MSFHVFLMFSVADFLPQDHDAAIALVSSHASHNPSSEPRKNLITSGPVEFPPKSLSYAWHSPALDMSEPDPDLKRAMDLISLHYEVKEKYMQGLDMGLQRARENVRKTAESLKTDARRRKV